MLTRRVARLRQTVDRLFSERHISFRSGETTRIVVLTPKRQMALAGAALGVMFWASSATVGAAGGLIALTATEQEAAREEARYQQALAERQARLEQTRAQLSRTRGSIDRLAEDVENRHAALARLTEELREQPGAAEALKTKPKAVKQGASAAERIQNVRREQQAFIERADSFSQRRADTLKGALRSAGVSPSAGRRPASAVGGPYISLTGRDTPSIVALDPKFAARVRDVAQRLEEIEILTSRVETLPLATPVANARLTSRFGVRIDPFRNTPAFHSGQDFAGAHNSPIAATAPGVVAFAGVRSGYGNMVEVDHGGGFRTRYAHLARVGVRPGQRVELGQTLGGMGSTGRSTGTHLHYEVWVNGRAQNPARYLSAGARANQG